MFLILPCAGESSRFPGVKPKWLLTQPNGYLMICDSIQKLNLENIEKIVVIATKKHLAEYDEQSILEAFKSANINIPVSIFVLNENTKSQPETVAKYLENLKEDVSFFVKDCDNQFDHTPKPINEVVVGYADLLSSDITGKSFCQIDETMTISGIVEKQVVSQYFCVGGYSFRSSKEYLNAYREINEFENLYISHIISHLLLKDTLFVASKCTSYEDWGTYNTWQKYRDSFCTLFVDIDGILVYNASEHFTPKWGSTKGIEKNIEAILAIQKTNKTEIVLVTARNEKARAITEKQLAELGIKYKQIIFGLNHSRRIIINDFNKTNPYPSCIAISLPRDSNLLQEVLPTELFNK